jgi:hypothetical protein
MVFAGSFWAGASERGLADGFRALGWAVQEVDSRSLGVNAGSELGLRLAARAFAQVAERGYHREILESCRSLKPDVFLTIKGIGISADLLRQIRKTGARSVMYYPDFHFDHPGVSTDSFGEYDLFVTTKSFQLNHLERMIGEERVAYVPHGYSDCVHRPVYSSMTDADFRADVLHAGNHSSHKQRWLEEALSRLPELSLEIIGNRWRERALPGPLSRSRMPGARMGVGYAEAIQTARINIAVHMGPTSSGWEDLVSTRTFEIPACGGFMLHVDNDEVRDLYRVGEEIDVFASVEELADKIAFYLPRQSLRDTMIVRAQARCVPAYSYKRRAEQIAERLVQL